MIGRWRGEKGKGEVRDEVETIDKITERGVSDERREEKGGGERKGHCNMQRIRNHCIFNRLFYYVTTNHTC